MLRFSPFKYYIFYVACIAYLFLMGYTQIIPWETPKHIVIILRIYTVVGAAFFALMVLFNCTDEMPKRKETFATFGSSKLWNTWYLVFLPPLVYSIYTWSNLLFTVVLLVTYFGMKALVKNHNKNVKLFREEELLSKARQENSEKVTL